MKKFSLIQSVFIIVILCLVVSTKRAFPPSIYNELGLSNNLLIGKWELVDEYEVDDSGKKIDVENLFGPLVELGDKSESNSTKVKKVRDVTLTFNTQGEGFNNELGYGFSYSFKDSVLDMGRRYKVVELSDSTLKLKEQSDLMSLSGGSDFLIFKRLNSIDVASARTKMKELIVGNWQCDNLIPVKTDGNAYFEDKEHIVDTLGDNIKVNLYFSFDTGRFEFGQRGGRTGAFVYDLVDSMINVEGIHFFTIIRIDQDSMSLLGQHSPENEDRYIWKMSRDK